MCDKIAFRNLYEELLQYPNLKGQLSNYVYVQGITLHRPKRKMRENIVMICIFITMFQVIC